jgi:hypothetical protein
MNAPLQPQHPVRRELAGGEDLLDALELLIESGRARTTEDLIRYAERAGDPDAADFLRELATQSLPLDLAFDALSVHVRIVAHKRNNELLRLAQDRQVGLVLPLPPHVMEAFLPLAKVTVLVPDGHHVPPHLRRRGQDIRHGSRPSRQAAGQLEVLVFEVYHGKDGYLVDIGVADIVDERLIPENTQLLVHLRPHRNPDDVPLPVSTTTHLRIL